MTQKSHTMTMRIQRLSIVAARMLASASALAAAAALNAQPASATQIISANFQGRYPTISPSEYWINSPTPPLAPEDVAGVVAVGNWNNVEDNWIGSLNTGTTVNLGDASGAASPVTLTFQANDSWFNDTPIGSITSPNAKLMNGIIKSRPWGGGLGALAKFTWNNLSPSAAYDVFIYFNMNGDGVITDFFDDAKKQYFHVTETLQFTDASTFVQAFNTDPNGVPDAGNFVHLRGLTPASNGSLDINAQWVSGADGNGIAGLQLIRLGAAPLIRAANGHFYAVVASPGIAWPDANAGASQFLRAGQPGHLVTITSQTEEDFVNAIRADTVTGTGVQPEFWLGGFQPLNQATVSTGWQWVNGEGPISGANGGATYSNWLAGEPNDAGRTWYVEDNEENYLGLGIRNIPQWNDEGNVGYIGGYIVEWDVDATVIVAGCDSGVPNLVVDPSTNTTISDEINACAVGVKNHGAYVSAVSALTDSLKKAGYLSGADKGKIQSCAAHAPIP